MQHEHGATERFRIAAETVQDESLALRARLHSASLSIGPLHSEYDFPADLRPRYLDLMRALTAFEDPTDGTMGDIKATLELISPEEMERIAEEIVRLDADLGA